MLRLFGGRQVNPLKACALAISIREVVIAASFVALLLPIFTLKPFGVSVGALSAHAQTCRANVVVKELKIDPITKAHIGAAIPKFTYVVNEDNTGDPLSANVNDHPWRHPVASYSPIVAVGDQDHTCLDLPDGRYLISVNAPSQDPPFSTDGYKLWGQHIKLSPGQNLGDVTIELLPGPLPTSKIKVLVFHDKQPVQGEADPFIPATDPGTAAEGEEGLAGFKVIVEDEGGAQVVVDAFNKPLCGGTCITDANGEVTITGLPNATYEIMAIPPDGSSWVQTSTFEGTHEQTVPLEEGSDGNGAPGEILREPGVQTAFWFGFVKPMDFPVPGPAANVIKGIARDSVGWPPFESNVLGDPVDRPWVALSDLDNEDEQVYTSRSLNRDGSFEIKNVPPSTYLLTIWDDPQDYILTQVTLVVHANGTCDFNGQVGGSCDLGALPLGVPRWFGKQSGYVFQDDNANGVRDPGEKGIPNFPVDMRQTNGSIFADTVTDGKGYYEFPEILPDVWYIAEVGYNRWASTGAAIHKLTDPSQLAPPSGPPNAPGFPQVDPIPTGTLLLSQLTFEDLNMKVDFGHLPWGDPRLSLSPALNGAPPPPNGGIVGIVFHDTTINEQDARFEVAETYEPGIPGVTINLYDPNGTPYDTSDDILINSYYGLNVPIGTDRFEQPSAANGHPCDVTDSSGAPLPDPNNLGADCVPVPMIAAETKGGGVFDGGYAFGDKCPTAFPFDPVAGDCAVDPSTGQPADKLPLSGGDYVTQVVVPPFYQITKEEDVSVDKGVNFTPAVPEPPCVGALHLVSDPRSPFDGQMMPLCDKKLVELQDGQNANSDFFVHPEGTDANGNPLLDPSTGQPAHWDPGVGTMTAGRVYGLIEDDLNVDLDKNSPAYGEKRRVPFVPVGVRDFTGRLLTTVTSDEYGNWEVLLPSTNSYFCPIPQGVCPGIYVFWINDPGDPQHPNANFNPQYLTEPVVFQVWPGLITFADTPLDPIEVAAECRLPTGAPELLNVSQPYGSSGTQITINGIGFGATQTQTVGSTTYTGKVTLDGTAQPIIGSWSDRQITFQVAGVSAGPHQLMVTTSNGPPPPPDPDVPAPVPVLTTVNGLTFHVIGTGYHDGLAGVSFVDPPTTVDPSDTPIQNAVDAAAAGDLIFVKPGTYHENIILDKAVTLQGYGVGGVVGTPELGGGGTLDLGVGGGVLEDPRFHVEGSVIDGKFFFSRKTTWETKLHSLTFGGNPNPPEGAAITLVANDGDFTASSHPQIDGLGIVFGRGVGSGGVQVNAYGRYLRISNNIFDNNQGGFGGAISIGEDANALPVGPLRDQHNDNVRIDHNRILKNGGIARAGAVGIFRQADNYEVDHNDFCGNSASEYGGAISHYGLSSGGSIHDNRIFYNFAFDSGGGIVVGGDTPFLFLTGLPHTAANVTGEGAGSATIERNLIENNISNDDGGGIFLFRAGTNRFTIQNNIIVTNVATHLGGGVTLDDASNVYFANNTVSDNETTNTAEDAIKGIPAAAGLVSEKHSGPFCTKINCGGTGGPADFSDPLLFNDIFWNNVASVLLPQATRVAETAIIDLEVNGSGPTEYLRPRWSILSVPYGPDPQDPTNLIGCDPNVPAPGCIDNPGFVDPTETNYQVGPNRVDPSFFSIDMIALAALDGDYHLAVGSPAIDAGTGSLGAVNAPTDDFDGDVRPQGLYWDIGADETLGAAPGPVDEEPAGLAEIGGNVGAAGVAAAAAPVAPRNAAAPAVVALRTVVTGNTVVVSLATAQCSPCKVTAGIKVRNHWRTLAMRKKSRRYVAVFRGVPRGVWLVHVVVKDVHSGRTTTIKRKVRVK